MIVYGYIINTSINLELDLDELDMPKGVTFYGGYSCSSYTPEMATLGIILDTKDFLFNPIALNNLNIKPTADQYRIMDDFEIPDKYKELFVSEISEVLIYDPTDD